MLKRMTAAALLASLLFSQPVSASLITQVGEAEAAAERELRLDVSGAAGMLSA